MSKPRILLTDDHTFLGRELATVLRTHPDYELVEVEQWHDARAADIMICGIPYQRCDWADYPADTLACSAWFQNQLYDVWKRLKPQRIITLGSVGQYPATAASPLNHDLLWDGYPAAGRRGLAEAALMELGQAYGEAYPASAVRHVILDGLYGPGDDFDEDAQVIPALVYKFVQAARAGAEYVAVHGTGDGAKHTQRSFLHVHDAIAALLLILEKNPTEKVINIAGNVATTVANLTQIISNFAGFTGKVLYDASKPDGREDRVLDNQCMRDLGFQVSRKLVTGIGETVKWYYDHASVAPAQSSV